MPRFRDRSEAGRVLAARLGLRTDRPDQLVLGLPRGGLPVAFEVAKALGAPLDVFMVRKLGFPGQKELAMGAVASGGVRVWNEGLSSLVSAEELEAVTRTERLVLTAREQTYRGGRAAEAVTKRSIILVDDGIATGSTMRAALVALRRRAPASMVVAVPVAPPDVCRDLRRLADEVVCAATPEPFRAVGWWYENFSEISDDEVIELLARAAGRRDVGRGPGSARSDPHSGT